jgi:hypothetical protein
MRPNLLIFLASMSTDVDKGELKKLFYAKFYNCDWNVCTFVIQIEDAEACAMNAKLTKTKKIKRNMSKQMQLLCKCGKFFFEMNILFQIFFIENCLGYCYLLCSML